MVSKSCILIPIATQKLTKAVKFTLGDNSEAICEEIAYMAMEIQTEIDVINIRVVPVLFYLASQNNVL